MKKARGLVAIVGLVCMGVGVGVLYHWSGGLIVFGAGLFADSLAAGKEK